MVSHLMPPELLYEDVEPPEGLSDRTLRRLGLGDDADKADDARPNGDDPAEMPPAPPTDRPA